MTRFDKDYVDICVPWIRPIDGTKPIYRTIFQFSNTFFKLMEAIQPQGLGVCILTTLRLHNRIGGFAEGIRVSEDFDYINRASLVGRFRVYSHVFVYHSVRRYKAEGVGNLVQKQFKSGFIYLFTGKAHDTDDYEFGTFSRLKKDTAEVEKLLSSFDRQSRRLRTQIEKMEGSAAQKAAENGGTRNGGTRKRRTPRARRQGERRCDHERPGPEGRPSGRPQTRVETGPARNTHRLSLHRALGARHWPLRDLSRFFHRLHEPVPLEADPGKLRRGWRTMRSCSAGTCCPLPPCSPPWGAC